MKMTGENIIKADRESVWQALNDPETLCRSIPGCESLERTGENSFKAIVVARIGPINTKFSGEVELSDLNPPAGYTLSGNGSAGPMGNAKGQAHIALEEQGDSTKLSYEVSAQITGKIAQLGARLIDSTAKTLAGQFFDRFGRIVTGEPVDEIKQGGSFIPVWGWVVLIILMMALVYYLYLS